MLPANFSVVRALNLRHSQPAFLQFVRNKYKKREYRGVFITDGMECHKGDVLVRTWKFNYYPGLNVSFTQELADKVLRAMCDGKVMITTEKIDPDFGYPDIETVYGYRKEQVEQAAYKLTFNVVPTEDTKRFRLNECI